jgi:Voltage-dependent anion channel
VGAPGFGRAERLITAKSLPAALQPVAAIELAPPALAGVAWFALASRGINLIAYAIGGYLVLMALVQVRLIPVYLKLRFSPGFWAFTFSYAIAITCALEWITKTNPPGATGYAICRDHSDYRLHRRDRRPYRDCYRPRPVPGTTSRPPAKPAHTQARVNLRTPKWDLVRGGHAA